MIDDILEFNKKFVESKGYEKYITNKYPDKKIAILSCCLLYTSNVWDISKMAPKGQAFMHLPQ